MLEKKLIKEIALLVAVIGGALLLLGSLLFFNNPKFQVGTYWVEKENGQGPYILKTGSRSEENRRKELAHDLQLDGPFVILKTTSEVGIIFTTPAVGRSDEFNHSDVIPQVKY